MVYRSQLYTSVTVYNLYTKRYLSATITRLSRIISAYTKNMMDNVIANIMKKSGWKSSVTVRKPLADECSRSLKGVTKAWKKCQLKGNKDRILWKN